MLKRAKRNSVKFYKLLKNFENIEMNETLVELENDADRLVQRKQTEKTKIEKLLEELRQTAELYVPKENKAFHNKFNRVKGNT